MAEPEAQNRIVVYQPNETVRLDVRLQNATVWLTQEQIANLFGTKRPAITGVAKMGAEVIPGLLESIRKATSERRGYGKGKKAASVAKNCIIHGKGV